MSWKGAGRLRQRLLHLNTAELARNLGVDYTTVLHWQAGRRSPSADALAALCVELKVSSDWLLGIDVPSGAPTATPAEEREALRSAVRAALSDPVVQAAVAEALASGHGEAFAAKVAEAVEQGLERLPREVRDGVQRVLPAVEQRAEERKRR